MRLIFIFLLCSLYSCNLTSVIRAGKDKNWIPTGDSSDIAIKFVIHYLKSDDNFNDNENEYKVRFNNSSLISNNTIFIDSNNFDYASYHIVCFEPSIYIIDLTRPDKEKVTIIFDLRKLVGKNAKGSIGYVLNGYRLKNESFLHISVDKKYLKNGNEKSMIRRRFLSKREYLELLESLGSR